MRYKILTFIFFVLGLAGAINLKSAYYVSSASGDDANPGTFELPFKTIQKAAGIMQPGDTCYIREGTYRESVVPSAPGSAGSPMVFTNYNNEKVIVTGTDLVTNWEVHQGYIYKATTGKGATQLFINGKHFHQASFPEFDPATQDTRAWADVEFFPDKTGIVDGLSQFSTLGGAYVLGLCGSRWISVIGTVTSQNGDKVSVNKASLHWSNVFPSIYLGQGKGFVTNHIRLLDHPGEWYANGSTLYLWPIDQKTPDGLLIEARTRQTGFDLSGKSYIVVKGIDFKAANVVMKNSSHCTLRECCVRYHIPFFYFSDGFNRDSRDPETWQGNGIEVSGESNLVTGCYIAHSWGDGITVWGKNNRVENCIIEDCDWEGVDSAPVSITGTGHLLTQNTLRNSARSILVHRYLATGKITYNNMYHSGLMCDDLGLTYSFQTDGKNTEIAWNHVHDNYAPHNGPGIYLDNGDTNYVVHHNVIWNCETAVRLNLPSVNNTICNNTFHGNKQNMGAWGPDGTAMTGVYTANNLSDLPGFMGNAMDSNFVAADTQLMDPAKFDFRLKENSVLIDKGIEIENITGIFSGMAPEPGAYEYNQPAWPAGSSLQVPDFADDVPAAPDNLSGSALVPGSISLFWRDNSLHEDGYFIERKTENSFYVVIDTVAADVVGFTDTLVGNARLYEYRVKAFNFFGLSPQSNSIKIMSLSDGSVIHLEAEKYTTMEGIQKETDHISHCDDSDWIVFNEVDFGAGFDSCTVKMAVDDEYQGKTIELRLDAKGGKLVGKYITTGTGSWSYFLQQGFYTDSISGVHDLYIVFKGGYGIGNFDWFEFARSAGRMPSHLEPINRDTPMDVYPNPSAAVFNVSFTLQFKTDASLYLYGASGNLVSVIPLPHCNAGRNEVAVDMKNHASSIGPGLFYLRIIAHDTTQVFSATRKLMYIP
jgi:hypothetical protein